MPTYDVIVNETGEEKEVICSYSSLKEKIDSGEWKQIHKSPSTIVSGVGSIFQRKTSDGWKDHLKAIKKGSGRSNTIKNL
jgi:hypothetical protein